LERAAIDSKVIYCSHSDISMDPNLTKVEEERGKN